MQAQIPEELHGVVHGSSIVELLFETDALTGHFDAGEHVEKRPHQLVGEGVVQKNICPMAR